MIAYTSREVYIEVDVVETGTEAALVTGLESCVGWPFADVGAFAGC